MEKETLIRPSLLSSDFTDLKKDLRSLTALKITHCHFDVMDGTFVDNISFGEPFFKSVNDKYSKKITFDVHLMTEDPLRQARQFALLGAKEISFHYEALHNKYRKYRKLRKDFPDVKFGLAFSPETDVSLVIGLASMFDFFLVMSVVPGKGGQSYIPGSENKVKRLDQIRKMNKLNFQIGVDGGLNEITGPLCYQNGADFLVMGSYFFHAPDRKKALDDVHLAINKGGLSHE
ncbi:MAG: ribulose-phosphate 3-epimerase [Bacilli bacterium]|jgi:ribulose-phosphate 3-epimerase